MRKLIVTTFTLLHLVAGAQTSDPVVMPYTFQNTACLSDQHRTQIMAALDSSRTILLAENLLPSPDRNSLVLFAWPLQLRTGVNEYGYHSISGHVDHNPAFPNQLTDYNCGQRTYDTPSGYNHKGTDYFLWPFSWNKMDSSDVEIVAAAAGTILYKSDGNFDRSCTFNNNNWNAVYVQHSDGSVAWYGHMKAGTLTTKNVGASVAQGEYLGVVGSSGNSSGPHLHFEIYDAANNLVDPYAGTCNNTNSVSWWQNQHAYFDAAVNHIATNDHLPNFNPCSAPDVKNEKNYFGQLDTIYLMSYYRFLNTGDLITVNIYQPNNTLWSTWSWNNTMPNYNAAYVYWWIILGSNAPYGQWKYDIVYNNQTYSHFFYIGMTADEDISNKTDIQLFPNPASRQIEINVAGTTKNLQFELYTLSGQVIQTQGINSSRTVMNLNSATGVYFYRIVDSSTDKVEQSGKLVVTE
jgi:murein DD-endopeptidase MepM/ murein hydrolase activator NlpD